MSATVIEPEGRVNEVHIEGLVSRLLDLEKVSEKGETNSPTNVLLFQFVFLGPHEDRQALP